MTPHERPTPRTELIMDNVSIAINADTREQSLAHKEEAEREIATLERSLAERTEERDALAEKSKQFPWEIVGKHKRICSERDTALAKLDAEIAGANNLLKQCDELRAKLAESEAHAKRLQDRLSEVQSEKSDALIAAVKDTLALSALLQDCLALFNLIAIDDDNGSFQIDHNFRKQLDALSERIKTTI